MGYIDVPYPLYAPPGGDVVALEQWLAAGQTLARLRALGLRDDEALHIFKNQLAGIFRGDINPDILVPQLKAIASSLPRAVGNDALPLHRLPSDLGALGGLLPKYAVPDDDTRSELVAGLTPRERQMLIHVVGPRLPRINEYLDSFEGRPALPAEALAVRSLAELVAELFGSAREDVGRGRG